MANAQPIINGVDSADPIKYQIHMFEHPFKWSTPPVRIIHGIVEVFVGWKLPKCCDDSCHDEALARLLNHKGLLEESKTVQDKTSVAPTRNVIEVLEKLREINVHKFADLLNMPEYYVWASPLSFPERTIDAKGNYVSATGYKTILFSYQSGNRFTERPILSRIYYHKFWRLATRLSSWVDQTPYSITSFTTLYCSALQKVFGSHPEKEDAFSMACRNQDTSLPPLSSLLYILDTDRARTSYPALGHFATRMEKFEQILQAECVLGSTVFFAELGNSAWKEKVARQMVIDCLCSGGSLTRVQPSYKQILAKACSDRNYNKHQCDKDSSAAVSQVELAAQVLDLHIRADECFSGMTDKELCDILSFFKKQIDDEEIEEVDEDVDREIRMAAGVVKMHMQTDSCLSRLTDRVKISICTMLIEKYGGKV